MPRRQRSSSNSIVEPNVDQVLKRADKRKERTSTGRRQANWGRRLGIVTSLLLAGLFILPNLIGWTSLRHMILNYALRDFQGHVVIDRLSLGWFQPIQMEGLHITDQQGQALVEVNSLRSSQMLIQLLLGRSYGVLDVVRPQINLVTRDGGSNFEDAVAKFLVIPDSDQTNSQLPNLVINVTEGQINLASQTDPQPWQLEKFQAKLAVGQKAALVGELETQVVRGEHFGNLTAQILLDDQQQEIAGDNGTLQLQCDQVGCGILVPILERLLGPVKLQGKLGGQITAQFAKGGQATAVQFQETRLTQMEVACARFLGSDVIRLASILANGELQHDQHGITASQLKIESDLGRLFAEGQFDWQQFQKLTEHSQLVESPFQLEGQVDLARLVKLLPSTLKLYDDLQIESGNITCQINSRPENGDRRVLINLDTANLTAVRSGQRLAWQQPIRLVSTLAQRRGQWELDEILCESDFLNLSGNGTLRNGKFTTQGDLSVLMDRLGQFMDIQGWGVQGKIQGDFGWQVVSHPDSAQDMSLLNQPLEFGGSFKIEEPLVALPGMTPWRESEVLINVAGHGAILPNASATIQQGRGEFRIGGERLEWELAEPVTDLSRQTIWKAKSRLTGGLARWLAHASSFADLRALKTDGQADLNALVIWDGRQLEMQQLRYQLTGWSLDGFGLKIREPEVTGEGTLRFETSTGTLAIPDLTLICSSVAARAEGLTLNSNEHLDVRGNVAFRADTHRVLDWLGLFAAENAVHFFGAAEGFLNLATTPQAIQAQLQGKIVDLIAAQKTAVDGAGWSELLREPNVNFQSVAGLSHDFSKLDLGELRLDASAVKVQATGHLSDLAHTVQADIRGTWSPDWIQIQRLLEAYTAQLVQLAGRQDHSFAIKGPLLGADPRAPWPPRELEVVSQVGWQQGVVCLLPVGPAELTASLNQGVAKLDTGIIPFSQGRVQLAPIMNLHDPNPRIVLPPGPLAVDVVLTPEICRDWMKFVAPLIADVASAQGKVSLETQGVEVPLLNPLATQGQGQVLLTEVTVGAGPMGMKIVEAVESVRMLFKPLSTTEAKDRSVWMRLDQQAVPFTISQGRVHHENLKISMKDLTLKTTGSVGFDQSLQMMVEIPIAEHWIAGEDWLASLKGETIKIPIGGTVTNPRLDMQAVKQLSMALVQRTATAKVNGLVGEQAGKLQSKVGNEFDKLQQKLGTQINQTQTEVTDKVQGEVLKGIDKLFGPKRDK